MSTSDSELQELQQLTRDEGLCGDISPDRFICTRKCDHTTKSPKSRHKAILFTTNDKQDEVVAEWDS